MKIWIRSQDKRNLIKADELNIYEFEDFTSIGRDVLDSFGRYGTKERAIEILDDIEKHIEKQGKTEVLSKNGIDCEIKYYGFVYEMPKD